MLLTYGMDIHLGKFETSLQELIQPIKLPEKFFKWTYTENNYIVKRVFSCDN